MTQTMNKIPLLYTIKTRHIHKGGYLTVFVCLFARTSVVSTTTQAAGGLRFAISWQSFAQCTYFLFWCSSTYRTAYTTITIVTSIIMKATMPLQWLCKSDEKK